VVKTYKKAAAQQPRIPAGIFPDANAVQHENNDEAGCQGNDTSDYKISPENQTGYSANYVIQGSIHFSNELH